MEYAQQMVCEFPPQLSVAKTASETPASAGMNLKEDE
jgi:hypothetical protein